MLIATGAFLYHETRGTTLIADEWSWALYRRGNDLGTFLTPWNEHLSLIPIAIYRLLFATAGLGNYAPYRATVLGAHLLIGLLIFVYAMRRVGSLAALVAAALMLFLGPAWQNFLWPFQIGWLVSLVAGLGALLMLDRKDRRGDLIACALVAVSLASSGLGVAILVGVVVDVLCRRRRWRDAWIFAAPLGAYALWSLNYQSWNRGNISGSWILRHNIVLVPRFVATAAASTLSALSGLSGETIPDRAGTFLAFGWPLLIVAVGILVWRLARRGQLPPRVLTLLTIALSFWILTAIRRADYSHPYESRYLYVGALFVILLTVELAYGVRLSRKGSVLIAAVAAVSIASSVAVLRDAAGGLRRSARVISAETGALDIGRPIVSPNFVADPFQRIVAGPYFSAEKANGTPAASPAKIAAEPEYARFVADIELIHIHQIALQRMADSRTGTTPAVDLVRGGTVTDQARDRACILFRPASPGSASAIKELQVTVPPRGLLLRAAGGPATASIRRFADEFQPVGSLPASPVPATLRIAPDLATQPWHVRLLATWSATVCGLG